MLEVPDSPKLYTTIYDNFKGVDYTNDASNIWKYRMAEGLNMAPDEAGQPWKRTGWEVAIKKSSSDNNENTLAKAFYTATNVTPTDITPQRTYYFELHGQDHMAYIAEVSYSTNSKKTGVVFIIRDNNGVNEIVVLRVPNSQSINNVLCVDANRCFFFEGNGTAGLYMFKTALSTDTSVNNMYIYTYESWTSGSSTVEGFRTRSAEPYVPTILISRSPMGGDGTLLESPNMITGYRKVKFYGDGSEHEYALPSSATSASTVSVEMLNPEGAWVDVPQNDSDYPWSCSSPYSSVVFTDDAPPSSPITGEDNVAITYESTGYTVSPKQTESEFICSTQSLLLETKSRSRDVTTTYTASGNVSYSASSSKVVNYSSAYGYIPRVTWTITANGASLTQTGTSAGTWGGWTTTPQNPSGVATGSTSLVGVEGLKIFNKPSGTQWVEMSSGFTTAYDSYSNVLNVTISAGSGGVSSSSPTTTRTSTSTGRSYVSNDTTVYDTYCSTVIIEIQPTSAFDDSRAATSAAGLIESNVSISDVIAYAKGEINSIPMTVYQNISTQRKTTQKSVLRSGSYATSYSEEQNQDVYVTYNYPIKAKTSEVIINDDDEPEVADSIKAFMRCKRATLFGSGILNAVFMTGSTSPAYTSRVWYSGVGDPTYFPDTNYIEAGSNDTNIMGMIRVGEYLGIIKQGANIDATIYLAYPTSYDDNTTYAIKQSITGVGAVSNGAFNIISDDSLFLSNEGIMAVSPDDTERQVKNRSYFINKPLTEEEYLSSAVSFVYDGMYLLCVPRYVDGVKTGVCYVLDGSQKTSWANEKTNLQFEAYYWDNIPAQCFARYDGKLWFADFKGNLCRFKEVDHSASYHDDYSATNTKCVSWTGTTYGVEFNQSTYDALVNPPTTFRYNGGWKIYSASVTGGTVDLDTFLPMVDTTVTTHTFTNSTGWLYNGIAVDLNDYGITPTGTPNSITVTLSSSDATMSTYGMTITDGIPEMWNKIEVKNGVPICARFATISDNDGATQYFKNMQKKGVVVSLLPKKETGATIYVKADEKDEIKTTIVKGQESELPSDVFIKKKIKKYKRLQFVVENNNYDETFGVDSVTKTYTLGNFSKNRRTT